MWNPVSQALVACLPPEIWNPESATHTRAAGVPRAPRWHIPYRTDAATPARALLPHRPHRTPSVTADDVSPCVDAASRAAPTTDPRSLPPRALSVQRAHRSGGRSRAHLRPSASHALVTHAPADRAAPPVGPRRLAHHLCASANAREQWARLTRRHARARRGRRGLSRAARRRPSCAHGSRRCTI